jgi:predicted AAA+ superfamily ATPase
MSESSPRPYFIDSVRDELQANPGVALLGPRQVGKTTLALQLAQEQASVYLDLESERDRARLGEPELNLPAWQDKLVILDEVHRVPQLFASLRGLIDQARRQGRRQGLYLLLGSASLDLVSKSGESLAGRVAYLELPPFGVTEVPDDAADRLWLRGGFPDSILASSDARSLRWRSNFIQTYLERDVPQFGPRIAAETLRRFWIMLAHQQASMLNVAQLARGLGVNATTAHNYIDLLCDLLLVRRLQPWHANVGKRLVKSPKVYVRDCGLVHALLNIGNMDDLLSHPVVGASWEGFVLENLLSCAPRGTQAFFYRTSGGAEIDILLQLPGGKLWAIEVKRSLNPKLERGFHEACADLQPDQRRVVCATPEPFWIKEGIQATPLRALCQELMQSVQA